MTGSLADAWSIRSSGIGVIYSLRGGSRDRIATFERKDSIQRVCENECNEGKVVVDVRDGELKLRNAQKQAPRDQSSQLPGKCGEELICLATSPPPSYHSQQHGVHPFHRPLQGFHGPHAALRVSKIVHAFHIIEKTVLKTNETKELPPKTMARAYRRYRVVRWLRRVSTFHSLSPGYTEHRLD